MAMTFLDSIDDRHAGAGLFKVFPSLRDPIITGGNGEQIRQLWRELLG
jgi:hypothetical protein